MRRLHPGQVIDDSGAPNKMRAAIACDACRRRKVRCSGEVPCEQCRTSDRTCSYGALVKVPAITGSYGQADEIEVQLSNQTVGEVRSSVSAEVSARVDSNVAVNRPKQLDQIRNLSSQVSTAHLDHGDPMDGVTNAGEMVQLSGLGRDQLHQQDLHNISLFGDADLNPLNESLPFQFSESSIPGAGVIDDMWLTDYPVCLSPKCTLNQVSF